MTWSSSDHVTFWGPLGFPCFMAKGHHGESTRRILMGGELGSSSRDSRDLDPRGRGGQHARLILTCGDMDCFWRRHNDPASFKPLLLAMARHILQAGIQGSLRAKASNLKNDWLQATFLSRSRRSKSRSLSMNRALGWFCEALVFGMTKLPLRNFRISKVAGSRHFALHKTRLLPWHK